MDAWGGGLGIWGGVLGAWGLRAWELGPEALWGRWRTEEYQFEHLNICPNVQMFVRMCEHTFFLIPQGSSPLPRFGWSPGG